MAKQQKPLTLPCAEISDDSLEVTDERMRKTVAIKCIEAGITRYTVAACSLNEETARQLFNWLGIWLHKH